MAQVGAPHGVRGDVRLRSFTEDPLALAQYGPFETEDGTQILHLLALRPGKEMLIARLKGIEDRTAAEMLTHARLYVPRSRLPKIEDETYYHADLVGLLAVDDAGAALGTVTAVHNFGAGDVIELACARGVPSVLIPFTRTVVPIVDLEAGKMTVNPPEGTFPSRAAEPRDGRSAGATIPATRAGRPPTAQAEKEE